MRPNQRRNNADRSRAAKAVGEPHLHRRLHLLPGDARREHLPSGGGADSWGADRENQLPFGPGRAQDRPRLHANHHGRVPAG